MLKCQVFLLSRIPPEGFSSHHYDLRRNLCTDCQEPSTLHSPCCPPCSSALGASTTLLLWLGCYKPGSCPQGLKHTGQFIPPGRQRLLQPFHRWMADTDYMKCRTYQKNCGTTEAGATCSNISIFMQMMKLTEALGQEKRVEQGGYITRLELSHLINKFLRNWKEARMMIWVNMLRTEEEGDSISFDPCTSLFCS